TAFASSPTDQSSRARPSLTVSPETPALTMVTSWPRARNAASSLAGKDSLAGSPSPAVRLSPSATSLVGAATALPPTARTQTTKRIATLRARGWIGTVPPPYVSTRAFGARVLPRYGTATGKWRGRAGAGMAEPVIVCEDVHVRLGSDAGAVHVLKGIDL